MSGTLSKLLRVTCAFFALSLSAQTVLPMKSDATGLVVYPVSSADFKTANGIGPGTGTVTSVSVATANGVSGTVATATTTPAITLSLGAITPSSVNGVSLTSGTNTFTLTLGTASLTVPAGVAFNANALLNTLANNSSATASFSNVDAVFHRVNGIFITGTATKVFTLDNTLEFAGTDSTVMTFPSTSATIARTDAANTFTGHQTIEGVTSTGATGTGNFVFSASPAITGLLSIGAVAGLTFNESGAISQPFGTFAVDTAGNLSAGSVDAGSAGAVKGAALYALSGAAGKYLVLQNTETLTANRALTITTGDAARTITLSGSPSLSGITTTGTGTIATTAGQTYTMPSTTATIARTDAGQTFTGTQNITGFNTSDSQLRVGSLEFQPYDIGNTFFGTNVYYNGSNFVYRATGYAGLFYFFYDNVHPLMSGQFRLYGNGSAGGSVADSSICQLKINSDGTFGVGPSISTTSTDFSAAKFSVDASGNGSFAGTLAVTGNSTLGSGTAIKNIRHGVSGAMTAGTVTVTDAGCTANTRYFFTCHTIGTVTIPSSYYASTRTASTSFVITSSQPTDTSTVDWLAIEP